MRWLDPAFPTFKDDSTVHPTITQYSQFGYGRRVCQGQEVTEADMFVGVGAIAWLFNIAKDDLDIDTDSAYESGVGTPTEQEKRLHIDEMPDISADNSIQTPPNEKSIEESLSTSWGPVAPEESVEDASPVPGAFPVWASEAELEPGMFQSSPSSHTTRHKRGGSTESLQFVRASGNISEPTITSKSASSDPTLVFTPLLIAKPYPFKFSLRIRSLGRAAFVRQEYEKYRESGEFAEEKVYWEGGTAGDKMYGWGKV